VPAVDLLPNAGLTGRLATVEVAKGAATSGSLAIIEGAIETYNASVTFYQELLEAVPEEGFHEPAEDETVALLVSDRHDNIGMDPVARAIGDAGGATVLITAGDDTSTGGSWEAFSISSLADSFDGYEVVAAAGNHDTGTASSTPIATRASPCSTVSRPRWPGSASSATTTPAAAGSPPGTPRGGDGRGAGAPAGGGGL
jgi:hypothetical protein